MLYIAYITMRLNVITVFNYPNEDRYNTMFKVWVLQVLRSIVATNRALPEDSLHRMGCVRVLTHGLVPPLKEFVAALNCSLLEICELPERTVLNAPNTKFSHNVGFKLYYLCQETDPFVFIDADAIVLTDMTPVLAAATESDAKPFISVDHQTIPRHTTRFSFRFMNTGFFIVSDPSFMDFDAIVNAPQVFRCPGTDQYYLNNYCRSIKYDYTHPLIHYGWNSCAGYKRADGSGGYVSDGIPEKHPIHILHYWDEFKPWTTPCPVYRDTSQKCELFDRIMRRARPRDPLWALTTFWNSFDGPTLYTTDPDIVDRLRMVNLRGKTVLHGETEADPEKHDYIDKLGVI